MFYEEIKPKLKELHRLIGINLEEIDKQDLPTFDQIEVMANCSEAINRICKEYMIEYEKGE